MKKILEEPGRFEIVDNEHYFDFIGYIDNHDATATLVVIFIPGDYDFDDEGVVYDESDWELERIALVDNEFDLLSLRDYAEDNQLEMIEIEPQQWAGLAADNRGRSMFNALREYAA